jgi:hypothetical protein
MAEPLYQASFSAGELAPHLHGRTDLQKYRAGAKVMRNWYVDYRGGAGTRPGSLFVGLPKSQAAKPRLIPFKFSSAQTYVLVLDGGGNMRIATNGAFVTETAFAITAGAHANPLTLTIPGHNYVVGDDVQISGVVGLARTNGVSGVNGRTLVVTVVAGNVVTFADPIFGTINATAWTAYSSGGSAARIYTVAHPWQAADLFALNFAQSADVIRVVHPNYTIYEIERHATTDWTIEPDIIGAKLAPPTITAISALNNPGGSTPQLVLYYVVTAVDDASGEESPASGAEGIANAALNQQTGIANSITWTAVSGASSYNVYVTQAVPDGDQGPQPYTYGKIANNFSTTFIDSNYQADFTTVPPTGVDPFQNGPVADAIVDQNGFGYIAPQWVIGDPTGTGASVAANKDITGAIINASVAAPGTGYSAPSSYITESDAVLGTGLQVRFNGGFTPVAGGYEALITSFSIVQAGTHYHVPVVTLTATLANNVWNINDQQGGLVLDASSTIVSASASGITEPGGGMRAVAGADTGSYYIEFTAGHGDIGLCTAVAVFALDVPSYPNTIQSGLFQRDPANNYFGTAWDGVMISGFTGPNSNIMLNNVIVGQLGVLIGLGHVIGVAYNATTQMVWFRDLSSGPGYWNGNATANPATSVGGISTAGLSRTLLYPMVVDTADSANVELAAANFSNTPAFVGAVPAGFTAGWPGPDNTIGTSGVYYLTTNGAIPVSFNTETPAIFPYTNGLAFTVNVVDTLPGTVIPQSQALGHVVLQGQTNPSVVALFDQRTVYAASTDDPDTFWTSRPGLYDNFDVSFPSQADDAITGTIVGQEVDAIQSLTPMASGLIALTSSGAYQISGGTPGAPLAPSTVGAQAQAFSGANSQPPLRVNYDLLYQQARGSAVRDLSYNFYVNVYTGQDVSALSSHLFEGRTLTNWTYAEQPWYQILGTRDDGLILSFTYLKEQELYGWSRWDTFGLYVAVTSIPENNQDMPYVAAQRPIGTGGAFVYTIERFQNRQLGGNAALNIPASAEDAWCVDAGVQYPLVTPAATLTATATALGALGAADVIVGGAGYSAAATLHVADPTGTGATYSLTISGGVITAAAQITAGSGYTDPSFYTVDTGGGSGAVIVAPIQNLWTFNANNPVFSSANIGQIIRAQGGVGTVTTQNSVTQIVANMTTAIAGLLPNSWGTQLYMMPATSGEWSITPQVSVIGGLDHLTGNYVQCVVDGSVIPAQQVVDGCITLPAAGSAITAGLGYSCQLQLLRPDAGEPTIQGRRKTVFALTIRTLESRGLMIGPDFNNMQELSERTNAMAMGSPIPMDCGGGVIYPTQPNGPQAQRPLAGSTDKRLPTTGTWNVDAWSCIMQTWPLPATILSVIPEVAVGDDPSP